MTKTLTFTTHSIDQNNKNQLIEITTGKSVDNKTIFDISKPENFVKWQFIRCFDKICKSYKCGLDSLSLPLNNIMIRTKNNHIVFTAAPDSKFTQEEFENHFGSESFILDVFTHYEASNTFYNEPEFYQAIKDGMVKSLSNN